MLKKTRRGLGKNDRFLLQQAQAARTRVYHALSSSKQPERRHQERPPRASPGPRAGLGCDVRHVGAARSRRFRVQPPCGTTASMAHCCVLCSSRRTTTGARGGDAEHRRLILPLSSERVVLRTCWRGARWLPPSMHAHALMMRQAAGISPSMLIAGLMFSSASPTSTTLPPSSSPRPLPTCSSNSSPPHASLASASIAQLSAPHASPDHALGHDARPPIAQARASNPPTTT